MTFGVALLSRETLLDALGMQIRRFGDVKSNPNVEKENLLLVEQEIVRV